MENKKIIAGVLSIFAITLIIGATYAFVTRTLTGTKKVTITAGTLSLVLNEENAITISDALPMYDQVGMIQEEAFEFELINNTSNPTDYTLKLQKVSTSNELSESDVKYYLTKDGVGKPALLSTLTDGVVDTGTIEGNDTKNYTLRIWISDAVTDKTTIEGKSLSYKLAVEASMVEDNKKILIEWSSSTDVTGLEKRTIVDQTTNITYYKINDIPLTKEELIGATYTIIHADGLEESFEISEEMLMIDENIINLSIAIISALEDGEYTILGQYNMNLTKGVWMTDLLFSEDQFPGATIIVSK